MSHLVWREQTRWPPIGCLLNSCRFPNRVNWPEPSEASWLRLDLSAPSWHFHVQWRGYIQLKINKSPDTLQAKQPLDISNSGLPDTSSLCVVIENGRTDFPVKWEIVSVGLSHLTHQPNQSAIFENSFAYRNVSFVHNSHGWTCKNAFHFLIYIIFHINATKWCSISISSINIWNSFKRAIRFLNNTSTR